MEEMNLFLRAHKIVDVRKEMANGDGCASWTFCITYMMDNITVNGNGVSKTPKVDYKKVLDELTFKKFSILRAARKELSIRDAIPAFSIFTDAELVAMAKSDEITEESISALPGIGKKKTEKYAKYFSDKIKEANDESQGISDGEDS